MVEDGKLLPSLEWEFMEGLVEESGEELRLFESRYVRT